MTKWLGHWQGWSPWPMWNWGFEWGWWKGCEGLGWWWWWLWHTLWAWGVSLQHRGRREHWSQATTKFGIFSWGMELRFTDQGWKWRVHVQFRACGEAFISRFIIHRHCGFIFLHSCKWTWARACTGGRGNDCGCFGTCYFVMIETYNVWPVFLQRTLLTLLSGCYPLALICCKIGKINGMWKTRWQWH